MVSPILKNLRVLGADELTPIYFKDDRIVLSNDGAALDQSGRLYDLNGSIVLPGFIDVHNHGAIGVDVNSATADNLIKVGRFLATNGVTAWMPTLVPDSDDNYRRAIDAMYDVMSQQSELAVAQIVGVHYEGVFANEAMCGALRPQYLKRFTGCEIESLPKLESGVHMTTLAPEIDGGIELIEQLVASNWLVSIGHTHADVGTLDLAFAAGARHITHFFNAMTAIHHRNIGVAGWGLTHDEVTFDIIADGVHVVPEMLKLAVTSKGTDKVSLISDSVAPTGMGDGDYELWGETVLVRKGRTQNERGSIAGSVITMIDAVKTMLNLGFSFDDIGQMTSTNPAKLLGLELERGSIADGKRADLVVMSNHGIIQKVFVAGQLI